MSAASGTAATIFTDNDCVGKPRKATLTTDKTLPITLFGDINPLLAATNSHNHCPYCSNGDCEFCDYGDQNFYPSPMLKGAVKTIEFTPTVSGEYIFNLSDKSAKFAKSYEVIEEYRTNFLNGTNDTYLTANLIANQSYRFAIKLSEPNDYGTVLVSASRVTRTITFNLNGGSGSFPTGTVFGGDTVSNPGNPTPPYNQFFKFWALSTNQTQEYNWNAPVTENITLIAIWQPILIIQGTTVTGFTLPPNFDGHVEIPNGVTIIGNGSSNFAGQYANLITSVIIPNTVTTIAASAFSDFTQLSQITIPASVTTIGDTAFGGTGLTNITIPSSVTTIGKFAFFGCSYLREVYVERTIYQGITALGSTAFSACESLRYILVSADSCDAYISANHWSHYVDFIVSYISNGDFLQDTRTYVDLANIGINDNRILYQHSSSDINYMHTITSSTPYRMALYQDGLGCLARGVGMISARTFDGFGDVWLEFEGWTFDGTNDYTVLTSTVEYIYCDQYFVLITDAVDEFGYGIGQYCSWQEWRHNSNFDSYYNNTILNNLLANYWFPFIIFDSLSLIDTQGIDNFASFIATSFNGIEGVVFYVQTAEFLETANELSENLGIETIIIPAVSLVGYEQPDSSLLIYNDEYQKGMDAASIFCEFSVHAVFFIATEKSDLFIQGITDKMVSCGYSSDFFCS